VASFQRLTEMKSLVEIYHEVHFASDCFTDSLDRREVIGETLTAKTQLQTLETPLFA
jgi:hypothetical protein